MATTPNLDKLAADPRYAEQLKRLQTVCDAWQFEVRDAHIMPESMLISEETGVPSRWHLFHGEDGTARGSLIFAAALNRRSPGDEES